jgi:hypothetical protein
MCSRIPSFFVNPKTYTLHLNLVWIVTNCPLLLLTRVTFLSQKETTDRNLAE